MKIKLNGDEALIGVEPNGSKAKKTETVVITGASAGIGLAVSRRFAEAGRVYRAFGSGPYRFSLPFRLSLRLPLRCRLRFDRWRAADTFYCAAARPRNGQKRRPHRRILSKEPRKKGRP